MNKFKVERDNQFPAMVELLLRIVSNQHAIIAAIVAELAKTTGRDAGEISKQLEKDASDNYQTYYNYLLETFGHLDVDDLIE